jgi:heterodisulfide reductase subunit C
MQAVQPENPVEQIAHTNVSHCYQCGKCSAGCPMGEHMDVLPNQLIRLVQLGRTDKAMRAESIWLCVSCQTCSTRCPKSVDCAGIMDALRELTARDGNTATQQVRTVVFQQAFLDNIRRNGRLNELELVAWFKTKAFTKDFSVPMLFKDAMLGPKMMQRGKFHLKGEKVRDRDVVKRIFAKCAS